MKILKFMYRDQLYMVNEDGCIKANGTGCYSKTWLFLGGSKHHWNTSITIPLNKCFENPELLNGCLGWDIDHGTTRRWGGLYNGALPRIYGAYIETEQ